MEKHTDCLEDNRVDSEKRRQTSRVIPSFLSLVLLLLSIGVRYMDGGMTIPIHFH